MAMFNPGDVVELKSGSLPMTVKSFDWNAVNGSYNESKLVCTWFDKDQKVQIATFPDVTLKMTEEEY